MSFLSDDLVFKVLSEFDELTNGMHLGQLRQLWWMLSNPGSTQTEIANACNTTNSAVSKNKNVFRGKRRNDGSGGAVDKELITIGYNPTDERQKLWWPTEASKELRKRIMEILASLNEKPQTKYIYGIHIKDYSFSIDGPTYFELTE